MVVGRLQQQGETAQTWSVRSVSWVGVGEGDDDQDDEEQRRAASSPAMRRDRTQTEDQRPASRSATRE